MRLAFPTVTALLLVAGGAARARDVTLEDAVAAAGARSPVIGVESARLAEAEADASAATAPLLPRITASASYTRLNTDRLGPLGTSVTGAEAPALYGEEDYAVVRGKQVLFDGLKSWRSRAASRHGVEAGRASYAAARADAVLAATISFTRLLAAQELTTVAEASAERQRAFVELARARAQAGRTSQLDVMKASAQRLEAERVLVTARAAEAVAAAELRRVLGESGSERLRARGGLPERAEPPPDEAVLLAAARAHDPDLLRARAQLAQASSSVSAAAAAYFPEVSVQGSYGYRRRDVGGERPEWVAGLYVDWALFEGGLTRAQVAKAEARERSVEESQRALELQLEADASEALAGWRGAAAAIEASRENAAVAREALSAAETLYGLGRATGLDVLTAQADVVRADAALVQARGDYLVARARVDRLQAPVE